MALAKELGHRPSRNTALPYTSYGSPIRPEPSWMAGSNILTSSRTYVERRPGFAAYENTPTSFVAGTTGTPTKLFTWHRWDGTFYTMLATLQSGTNFAKLYKLKVGTDNSFQLIYTSATSDARCLDFVVSDNYLFFSGGGESKKWDGTTVTRWGIISPASPPSTSTSGTGITAVTGWQYVYCYYNSNSGHVSSPSQPSVSTGAVANKTVNVTVVASTDPQVTNIRIFRSTDGGGGIFYEIGNSPFPNTSTSQPDTTTDANLSTVTAPTATYNDVPFQDTINTGGVAGGMVWFQNRIWAINVGFYSNKVYFSGWEEINLGLEEECWPSGPAGNFFATDDTAYGLAATTDFLLIFTPTSIHKIEGNSLDTFARSFLVKEMGCVNRMALAVLGKSVVWFNTDNSVWMTDGFSLTELSIPIRNDIKGIDPTQVSLSVYNQDLNHWLLLFDGQNNRCFPYDLDTQQWMPAWNFGFTLLTGGANNLFQGSAAVVFSGLTGAGQRTLFASTSSRILSMTPSAYLDNGSAYTGFASSSLFDLTPGGFEIYTGGYGLGSPAGHLGEPEYVVTETNNILPSSVRLLTDDDPFISTFGEPIVPPQNPQNRQQANDSNLLEKWWYQRKPAARRAAVRFDWPAASTNFKLYSFDFAYRQLQ